MERKYSIPIKEWPEEDRPRERLLARGARELTDAELIAILLRTGDGGMGKSAVDHARELLLEFGSLASIDTAGIGEICRIKGIGPAKAATIKAALELGRRMASSPEIEPDVISSPDDVWDLFRCKLGGLKHETFWEILLDFKNHVLNSIKISEGILTETLVHPREVFAPAIRENAARVIFVHNHPSGDPTPSDADRTMHSRLVAAGELLGIPVLDHIVIGQNRYERITVDDEHSERSMAAD